MASAEGLVKVRLDLPDDETVGAESFWARPLGDDLYEVQNVPFFAYDLHFGDVVRAVSQSPDLKPTVLEVVRRSGHKTLRVLFSEQATNADVRQILEELNRRQAYYEHARGRFYAIDVEPAGDYQAVCDFLWTKEQDGVLHYETGTT